MIITIIIESFMTLIRTIINSLPTINIDFGVSNDIWNTYWSSIFDNLGLIDIIMPLNTAKMLLGLILALLIVKWTYGVIMFIVKKIPFASIR